ncbi:cytochrome c peroxidase [Pseudoalteromonas phenolica]|uniref:cytochrome c peroxidase n=1 Tax=Pseudoalteromonas phenolica TaxID=161398 RepID=UPI0033913427
MSQHTIQDAIAEFERSLITTNAPFDHWLMGGNNAISAQAKQAINYLKTMAV